MGNEQIQKLGDIIFRDIDNNVFLNELYDNMLYNYALKVFHLDAKRPMRAIDLTASLRFADLLSKSTHPQKADQHKMWAQEIVTLLNALYPDNLTVRTYAGLVFSSTGNHRAKELLQTDASDITVLDRIFNAFNANYLTIPAENDKQFFRAQKSVYDHLGDDAFSYSGPTSMGKSFIMRMFIKAQIKQEQKMNFALIVPTKALINEIRSQTINDLKDLLAQHNYRVVTAAGDLALDGDHNYILILTPERLLYLLISKPQLQIDHLFIDEAHKMSGKNSRGPFYYKVVDMLASREKKPHFIFASPNIPNPEVYLKLLPNTDTYESNKLASTFSPVTQFKFLLNFNDHTVSIYNDRTQNLEFISTLKDVNNGFLNFLTYFDHQDNQKQAIVYCGGKNQAVSLARDFAKQRAKKSDAELESLAKDIRNEVHGDYYLADILEKGVAYHIGYLPSAIRMRIEDLFREKKITTIFCTSTLVEGVNLPADNLYITNFRNGRAKMTPVDFRNLIGRAGRIRFNLYGNVFLVSSGDRVKEKDYIDLLKADIPEQKLSLESDLKPKLKKHIVNSLIEGKVDIERYNDSQSEEEYVMMRKFALILLRDIMNNRNSLVRREFMPYMKDGAESKIRTAFTDPIAMPDDDINVSVDQAKTLTAAIAYGLSYPTMVDGTFDYDQVVVFLEKLCKIFNWSKYESSSLGKTNELGQHPLLRWYAVVLIQWMEGNGLSSIMQRAIRYRQQNPENFWIDNHTKTRYDDSLEHRNAVIADTLEVIENVILFSISNYFLRFSNEYKKIHGISEFDNNWYEYVEYGTTNPITIQLQRNGFSREVATYIRQHQNEYVATMESGEIKIRSTLLNCRNAGVRKEAEDIQYNVPGLFVEDWIL